MNVITREDSSSALVISLGLRKRLSRLKISWSKSKTSLKIIASVGAGPGLNGLDKIKSSVKQLPSVILSMQNDMFKGGRSQGSEHFWWATQALPSEINPYDETLPEVNSFEELPYIFDQGEYFGF